MKETEITKKIKFINHLKIKIKKQGLNLRYEKLKDDKIENNFQFETIL